MPKLAFALADNTEELSSQFDSLLLGVGPEDGETADQLLGFGERAIGDSELVTGEPHARAESAWQAAFRGDQPAGFETVFDELAHLGHFFLRRWSISFHRFVHA